MKKNKLAEIFILLILFLICPFIEGQNIYNTENSLKFADYLFKNQEYTMAAEEYERVVFLMPDSIMPKMHLIRSYHHAGQTQFAISRTEKFYPAIDQIEKPLARYYSKLLILNNQFDKLTHTLKNNHFIPEKHKFFLNVSAELYQKNWGKSSNMIKNSDKKLHLPEIAAYEKILKHTEDLNYKKPWISLGLSTVIPGLGKAYSGYWKDGLFSFLVIGISGWQAYRGFDKNGIKSVYGWIMGSLGAGFYIGNLYGSYKAANKKNHDIDHEIIEKVDAVFAGYSEN